MDQEAEEQFLHRFNNTVDLAAGSSSHYITCLTQKYCMLAGLPSNAIYRVFCSSFKKCILTACR